MVLILIEKFSYNYQRQVKEKNHNCAENQLKLQQSDNNTNNSMSIILTYSLFNIKYFELTGFLKRQMIIYYFKK